MRSKRVLIPGKESEYAAVKQEYLDKVSTCKRLVDNFISDIQEAGVPYDLSSLLTAWKHIPNPGSDDAYTYIETTFKYYVYLTDAHIDYLFTTN